MRAWEYAVTEPFSAPGEQGTPQIQQPQRNCFMLSQSKEERQQAGCRQHLSSGKRDSSSSSKLNSHLLNPETPPGQMRSPPPLTSKQTACSALPWLGWRKQKTPKSRGINMPGIPDRGLREPAGGAAPISPTQGKPDNQETGNAGATRQVSKKVCVCTQNCVHAHAHFFLGGGWKLGITTLLKKITHRYNRKKGGRRGGKV